MVVGTVDYERELVTTLCHCLVNRGGGVYSTIIKSILTHQGGTKPGPHYGSPTLQHCVSDDYKVVVVVPENTRLFFCRSAQFPDRSKVEVPGANS